VVIDCVEFSERFRAADPVCDVAFTVMELLFHRQIDLARSFADAYLAAAADEEGRALLPFYVAYRSLIRAKVRGLEMRESEIPDERRNASAAKARAHGLLALGELEAPAARPLLVLVGGLPGTGKSTLARALGAQMRCDVIRSDVVRKELAGVAPSSTEAGLPPLHAWRSGLYAPEETNRTYGECRRRALDLLFQGKRAVVDATFADEALRRSFLDAAASLGVPVVWFVCTASADAVRERLASRRGDASDADFGVYEEARRSWTPAGRESRGLLVEVDTEPGERAALAQALSELSARGFG
jgi:predicted kinase